MAAVTKAVDRLLLQQEPHPGLVLDRYWVVTTNEAAPPFFGSFVDLEAHSRATCSTSCLILQECGHSSNTET